MSPTVTTIILGLLGGTNILSFIAFYTERQKRKHEESIKESDALKSMRDNYAVFVEDVATAKKRLQIDFDAQRKELLELRYEKDYLRKELSIIRVTSTKLSDTLYDMNKKCSNNCFNDGK